MKKFFALLGTVAGLAIAGASANATTTVVPIGTSVTGLDSHFFFKTSPPSSTFITANFGATPQGPSKTFTYNFTFSVNQNGKGSGSLSTSFASSLAQINITSVLIDGILQSGLSLFSPSGPGQTLTVSGINIPAGLNTIQVNGITGSNTISGTFDGTTTYVAGVPEPATWATFLLGFGFMGFVLRRKLSGQVKTA